MATQTLGSGSTLLVDGPASVKLTNGEALSIGAPLNLDQWNVIRQDQRLAIETPNLCSLEIRLGRGGKHAKIEGSTIPTGWREASQVLAQAPGVAVVLGDVDSGKSTLSSFLANEFVHLGRSVSVIDGDVGQADIGPPTTISMSHVQRHVFGLQYLSPEVSLFIGDTSPSLVPEKVLRGLARLKDIARKGSELIIVNTDGWVRGEEALQYKSRLLEALRPDLLLGIDLVVESERLLDFQDCTMLRLGRSQYARVRSREERRRARESGYRRFLKGAEPVHMSLSEVNLRRFDSRHQLKINEVENLRGLIAGLLDDEDRLLSISRIESMRNGSVNLWTVLDGKPRTIELGSVVLSRTYGELGYDA